MSIMVGYVATDGRALVSPGGAAREFAPLRLHGAELATVLRGEGKEALHVFTDAGLCYGGTLWRLPREEAAADGAQLVDLIEGDRVCAAVPADAGTHYALVTEQGTLKRLERRALARADADGLVAFRIDGDDRLVAVVPHETGDDLLVSTAGGKLLRIELGSVRPIQTADAGGVAGIALAAGDRVAGAARATGDELLVVHEQGSAKRVALADYPRKGRATGGVASAAVDKPTRHAAGPVAGAWPLDARGSVLYTAGGRLIRVDPGEIELGTRAIVSKPWQAFRDGDRPRGVIAWPSAP
jgi:DNA gyrase subunit A